MAILEYEALHTVNTVLHDLFLFFLNGCIGLAGEVAFAAITTRKLVNRGFLNGPICPIYGFGMVAMILLLGQFSTPAPGQTHPWYVNAIVVFFGGMAITTLIELIGGYILYKAFHTRWWDYSMYRGNLGGFICPQFSLLWGVGSVVLMLVIHPLINGSSNKIPAGVLCLLDVILLGLFLADVIVSFIEAVGLRRHLDRIDELRTMEGRANAAELRSQLREMADRAKALRATTTRMGRQRFWGTGRLLRAFPDMVPDRREALDALRASLNRLASAARQAVEDNVEDWKKENHR